MPMVSVGSAPTAAGLAAAAKAKIDIGARLKKMRD